MVTPVFQITDYPQAIAFYVDWLGFHIDWEERPASGGYYLQISCVNIVLHLTNYPNESSIGVRAMVQFTGLLSFQRLLLTKESAFSAPQLQKTTWNDKVMQLELFDPVGNCLMLAEVCIRAALPTYCYWR